LSALHSTQEAGGWDSGNNITAVSYETLPRDASAERGYEIACRQSVCP